MDERRLSPRRQMQGHWVAVPVAESIRILISASRGVLLETASRPDPRAIAKLKFSVGGQPLAADVEVRRVTAGPSGYRVGARFVELTPAHRRLIERFMGQ